MLTTIFAIAPLRNFAMASPLQYWAIGLICAGALLVSAALGYAFIERPGIALGKRLIRRRNRSAVSPPPLADNERIA